MDVMKLKELRVSKGLTQKALAEYLRMPLRTYKNYENDPKKEITIKYQYILEQINKIGFVDEEHGILSIETIKKISQPILASRCVSFCVLFGSYAKGIPSPKSDIDLVVSSDITGLAFFGLAEELREALHKKIDLLNLDQFINNKELLDEVLHYGIRIYDNISK